MLTNPYGHKFDIYGKEALMRLFVINRHFC